MNDPVPTVLVEVTNTLSIGFTTGIQRVVREVVRGLGDDPRLEVVPLVQPRAGAPFRRLTPDEIARLAEHPSGGAAGRRADRFGPLSPLLRRVGDHRLTLSMRAAFASWRAQRRELHPEHRELALTGWPEGATFLDIEGSWYDPTPRSELLPELRAAGVRPAMFCHDALPVLHPEWFPPLQVRAFEDWLRAHLAHSELFLSNSQRTAEDLREAAARLGVDRRPEVVPVPLGADLAQVERPTPPSGADRLEALRYLLVVGTLEPRKDQATLLDAFDRLAPRRGDLGLVVVGKEGWMVAELVRRLRRHPLAGRRLFWLGDIGDAELAWLYEHAFVVVAPSRYEGLGVPVREALGHGCATIASTGGAQAEAAGGAAELFEPGDVDALCAILDALLDEPERHLRSVERARSHRLPTWADTTRAVTVALGVDS